MVVVHGCVVKWDSGKILSVGLWKTILYGTHFVKFKRRDKLLLTRGGDIERALHSKGKEVEAPS